MTILERVRCGRIPPPVKIELLSESGRNEVEEYWSERTVNPTRFRSIHGSLRSLQRRFDEYPLFKESMQLWGDHENQIVLDYGCGPGDDLVGMLLFSSAKKVIGMDISAKGLGLAVLRLALHRIEPQRVELFQVCDQFPALPLETESVDFIHCGGVLHHSSCPERILREFHRVLKPISRANVMVYNYDSLWLHLYTAYQTMIVENKFAGLSVEEAFSKNVDGESCPIAVCYRPREFMEMCEDAGFLCRWMGGYLSQTERGSFEKYGKIALDDERLSKEHKEFIRELVIDSRGYPTYRGKYAGVGGAYRLTKINEVVSRS